ncbi:serine-protein kinase RsbW [Psychrobacter pasteurii]|uniref:Serine-protein kinase RsbW n=2 Tax=Psychrobacter pasteurii TaxID=1945520 RepID=A0A1R4EF78_9GAMM|nr:serine-protein kinase RsbW [Psychrobacter pasteurii]
MKKISEKQRQRIVKYNIRQRKLQSRNNRTDNMKKERIKFSSKLSLFVPSERNKIIKILKSIPNNTFDSLYLNFIDLETINPLTALHIVHVLDKYKDRNVRFKSRNSKSLIPRAVFKLLKLNKNFGFKDVNKTNFKSSVDNWSMFSGYTSDLPDDMVRHIHDLKKMFKDPTVHFRLVTAISEAINNVIHHAYHDDQYNKWYVLTHIDDRSISVVVSDLGVTIPYTAPVSIMNTLEGTIANAKDIFIGASKDLDSLRKLKDSQLIKYATYLNSTSTKVKGRGQGFDDILNLVKNTNEFPEISRVHTSVLSKYGSYLLESNSDGSFRERSLKKNLEDFTSKIDGTVISWVIQLV